MKQQFKEHRFLGDAKVLLGQIIKVVESYKAQGYRLTLRQLYYQLVVQNIFANKQANYQKLSVMLGHARMAGVCDWDVIEDRIRVPKFPNEFIDVKDGLDTISEVYRRRRWIDQDNYVEVWVEKDALSGVMQPITSDYHVHLLVNRGYSSISAMYEAARRFRYWESKKKECHLLYFGDHDPSGEDMVRDIDERLQGFYCTVNVQKIALTRDQVTEYDLPPNPAKMSDTRAEKYVAEHGDESWELDALRPDVLETMLKDSLDELIDQDKYDAWVKIEDDEKEIMSKMGLKYFDPRYRECICKDSYDGLAGDISHTGQVHRDRTGSCGISGCKCKKYRYKGDTSEEKSQEETES